jgi:DNA-binding Lrp family transcriptional regulator
MADALPSPSRLRELELARLALIYRRQRWRYSEIAAEIGVSESRVRNLIARALEESAAVAAETVEQIRQLDLDRLDDLERRIAKRIENAPESKSIAPDVSALLSVMDRRARMLGVDAPSRSLSVHVSASAAGASAAAAALRSASDEELAALASLSRRKEAIEVSADGDGDAL